MIAQIIQKHVFCVTDVRAIGTLILRQLMCVIGAFVHRKYLIKAPE